MSQLITDTGFVADDWTNGFRDWEGVTSSAFASDAGYGLDVPNTVGAEQIKPYFNQVAIIRIDFPSSADGRGFTIARHLRLLGFGGRLRAHGHLLADQYTMARRCGFDEVEISDDLAARQPQEQWLFRADWQSHDYQARLRQRG
ncbi:MAG: oxidoreductase [Rhodobacteraceae bacterium]|nr:MAG: oxidoreductase [Paracoccaceae bacterium]